LARRRKKATGMETNDEEKNGESAVLGFGKVVAWCCVWLALWVWPWSGGGGVVGSLGWGGWPWSGGVVAVGWWPWGGGRGVVAAVRRRSEVALGLGPRLARLPL